MKNTYVSRVEKVNQVWTPKAKLFVPHKNKEISFASPSFGPDTYLATGKEILSKSLNVPTGDYTSSLLYSAYCDSRVSDEPEFQDVRNIMKNNWLWVFNKNGWTDKGVYVIQDSNAEGRTIPLNINELEKMLKGGKEINGVRFSKDGLVRFAQKGSYKLGNPTSESLSTDGFVIASYNVDGAKKLAEVSSKFKSNPITYGVEVRQGNVPELRISVVYEYSNRLRVDGDWNGSNRSRAFGVLK